MKRLITMAIVALTAIEFVSAAPTVTDITAKQRYPWNGLVDIACKVSGIEADAGGYEFAVVAVNKETGREYTVSNFSIQHNGEEVSDVCGNGDYSLLWNAREDMGQVVFERMTVRITLEALAVSVGKVQLWEGGPYWADRNIGAKKPEDYGLYFWWGDTVGYTRSGGTWTDDGHRYSGVTWVSSTGQQMSSSPFSSSFCSTYGKSEDTLQSTGWMTSDGGLAPAHDAAHVKWGGSWRMPTTQELDDLCRECDWTGTNMNGVSGYVVRGRGTYASNSIFLPAAGDGSGTSLSGVGSYGYYWSSRRYKSSDGGNAWGLRFYYRDHRARYLTRCCGQSIRPVQ